MDPDSLVCLVDFNPQASFKEKVVADHTGQTGLLRRLADKKRGTG